LLHPTSFPGPYGLGDLGDEAYRFIDWMHSAGQRVWQILPLGPTGYGDSPYQSFSAFAGNPLLISPDKLVESGVLSPNDMKDAPELPEGHAEFDAVAEWKSQLLRRAYENFKARASDSGLQGFESFCNEMANWLDDFALYMALKEGHNGKAWTEWDPGLAQRDYHVVNMARHELQDVIDMHRFVQFQFYKQWWELRHYCNERDIIIVGDMPIYVAHDSVDVWANQDKFLLDEEGEPTVVAGVPPDYFSETGQLWGNPIYNWEAMAADGYGWWVSRMRTQLRTVDVVRIDHFRGFEAYWQVPAEEETAINGEWIDGPRDGLFEAFRHALGHDLPIMAENLGIITEEVEALRERFNLPGMAVFQFGFGEDAKSSAFPPHTFTKNLVAYTGTHDNDTTLSWWKELSKTDKKIAAYIKDYLDTSGREFNWVAMRALAASVADTVIFPLQDVLGLGNEARMNKPGQPEGNWKWRYKPNDLTAKTAKRLKDVTELYGRIPEKDRKPSSTAHTG